MAAKLDGLYHLTLVTEWPPASWSLFMQPIHTNNDLKGRHWCPHTHACSDQLNLYRLMKFLRDKSENNSIEGHLALIEKAEKTDVIKFKSNRCFNGFF